MNEIWLQSSFEGELVKYYEKFFYHGKEDLVRQTNEYIKERLVKYVNTDNKGDSNGMRILDIGCGTGLYEEGLADMFGSILALDISDDMVDYAKTNHNRENCQYEVFDICEKQVASKEFDAAISLSHVIGYQLSNQKLSEYFENIAAALKSGGVFAFNFYHEPGILCGHLEPKVAECNADGVKIVRHSDVSKLLMENALQLEYDYDITDEENLRIRIKERMRYFSFLEIKEYLNRNGMDVLEAVEFLKDKPLDGSEWNAFIVAGKR